MQVRKQYESKGQYESFVMRMMQFGEGEIDSQGRG